MIFLSATSANKSPASVLNNGLNDDFLFFLEIELEGFLICDFQSTSQYNGIGFSKFHDFSETLAGM